MNNLKVDNLLTLMHTPTIINKLQKQTLFWYSFPQINSLNNKDNY